MNNIKNNSYKQIVKSTGIVGGAQVLQIVIGIVKTKFIAVILGSSGLGLLGLYQSILDLVRTISSLGINYSGVKSIAEANYTNNSYEISKATIVLRRWARATGIIGCIIVCILCVPFSKYTFGNASYAYNIAILSITLVFTSISQCQSTLLQGMQRIPAMAKSTILVAIASCVVSILLYYYFGSKGIVPSVIFVALVSLLITWLFSKNIPIEKLQIKNRDVFSSGIIMAKLGFFMVINTFLATATMYFVKIYITKKSGLEAVGFFQAAWTISNTYVGIVLNAMLADFFPRLSSKNHDNQELNRLTNEQGEITVILGSPLLILLLSSSSLIIKILYSTSFPQQFQY